MDGEGEKGRKRDQRGEREGEKGGGNQKEEKERGWRGRKPERGGEVIYE